MRSTELSIVIDHPAQEVFHFATDPAHLSEWIMGDGQTMRVSEGPLGEGYNFAVTEGGDNRRREFVYNVVGFESPTSFTVKSEGRLLTYTSCRIFQGENGKTRVTDVLEMENPPGLLNLLGGYVLGQLKKSHQNSLERLKAAIE